MFLFNISYQDYLQRVPCKDPYSFTCVGLRPKETFKLRNSGP